jgi:hypothetical protein
VELDALSVVGGKMASKSATLLCLAVALLVPPDARAEDFEPEEGVFAGYGAPEPHQLLLRRTLFDNDNYRLCQLTIVPSFESESTVYIVRLKTGSPFVVSRRLNQALWGSMLDEMKRQAASSSISLDALAQIAALEKLRLVTETHKADLDAAAVDALNIACTAALLRVRYPKTPTRGLDGVTYHASHWIPGAFLSGRTWSPKKGTLTSDFVDFELLLQTYAEATPDARLRIRAELVVRAARLTRRSKASG